MKKPPLGQNVREHREALGMSQAKLAKETGLTQPSISAIESGETKLPSYETVEKIAWALNCPVSELTRGQQLPISDKQREEEEEELRKNPPTEEEQRRYILLRLNMWLGATTMYWPTMPEEERKRERFYIEQLFDSAAPHILKYLDKGPGHLRKDLPKKGGSAIKADLKRSAAA